jgi:hypothetical protein
MVRVRHQHFFRRENRIGPKKIALDPLRRITAQDVGLPVLQSFDNTFAGQQEEPQFAAGAARQCLSHHFMDPVDQAPVLNARHRHVGSAVDQHDQFATPPLCGGQDQASGN